MPSKIQVGKAYTREQLKQLIDASTAEQLKLQGYALRYEPLAGTYTVVPWHEAAIRRNDGSDRKPTTGVGTFDPLPAIVKRTPQERLNSLTARWLKGMQAAGGIPHLLAGKPPEGATAAERDDFYRRKAEEERQMDEAIKSIVGEAWKAGRPEITAEVVRQVAAHFLSQSERQHEEKLDKQITRHED